MANVIVTIDGPAGAGKSSAAKLLAARLGFAYLDTGAMYRAVALAGLRRGLDLKDETALTELLDSLHLEMPGGKVLLDGEDVGGQIRDARVTEASAPVASSPVVRRRMIDWQRAIAATGNFVCEGRDQGTLVFPNAACKFYLDADPLERAHRRHREWTAHGDAVSLDEVLAAQQQRDARDAARDLAPLRPAHDAVLVDSTNLDLEEVVAFMEREVAQRFESNG